MCEDQVKVLKGVEIIELQEIYRNHIPYASNVDSLLKVYFKWEKSHPERDYLIFFGLNDDWRRSGTFLMKFKSFDIFLSTLDDTGTDLYNLLIKSKALIKIHPQPYPTNIYGTRNKHLPALYRSLHELLIFPKIQSIWENKTYWLPKEEALKYVINCPENLYIDNLKTSHVDLICSLWPHAHAGSKEYLKTYIEMNKSYGLFLKETGELISWVLQNFWGTLIVLETVPEHKRKGYGTLMVKKMSLEIAKDGINPLCGIVLGNTVSESLFEKLGFKHIDTCTFMLY